VDAAAHLALRIGSEHGLPDVAVLLKFEYGRVRAVNHIVSILSGFYRAECNRIQKNVEDWLHRITERSRDVEREDAKCLATLNRTLRDIRTLHKSLDLDEQYSREGSSSSGGGGQTAGKGKHDRAQNANPPLEPPTLDDPDIQPHDPEPQRLLDKARSIAASEARAIKDTLKKWFDQINQVSTRYTSDRDEHILGELAVSHRSLEGWSSHGALLLRKNEKTSSGKEYADLGKRLIVLKHELEGWIQRLHAKVSGDDGVAAQVISLQNQLEDKYTIFASRDNTRALNITERMLLSESLLLWSDQISILVGMYRTCQKSIFEGQN
jgi:hypothetical protein